MSQKELVLAVTTTFAHQVLKVGIEPTAAFHPREVPELLKDASLDLLRGKASFTDRDAAENNPALKQLIVYALVTQGGKVLCYKRGKVGGEPRLHAKRSVGVGGHINPGDWRVDDVTGDSFEGALRREIYEEIGMTDDCVDHVEFLGFVNEDTTDVGRVHLGLVYLVDLKAGEDFAFEQALVDPQWLTREELQERDDLELWSSLVRDGLGNVKFYQPHQRRVIQERAELRDRVEKLEAFLRSPKAMELKEADPEAADLMVSQAVLMWELVGVLAKRIALF